MTSLPVFPKLVELSCYWNKLTSLPVLPNLVNLDCDNNELTSLQVLPNLVELTCVDNKLTLYELNFWKKIWSVQTLRKSELRKRGIDVVIKILKNRTYLHRLNDLHHELKWSPFHPGSFYLNKRMSTKWKDPKINKNITGNK